MKKKFYVTTPIYYANALPHVGHANSSFIADFYARMKRLLWYEVKFSTWMDENGQKMAEKAQSQWKEVMEFLDEIYEGSLQLWKDLEISYTDFIRTTQEDHKQFVQEVIKKIAAKKEGNPDIYEGKYQGLYCVGCEASKNERDLTEDWLCPDHLKKPIEISETNFFFNLKKYAPLFEKLWEENPSFVDPVTRFNEVKAFIRSGLEDFSISRENKNGIGIPFPLGENQVVYVRFDALFNYITVCYRNGENGKFRDDDTYILHVMGKDIVKFHATYRPAMLQSAGYRLPDKEFVTGYLTVDGQKMSKTIGNVIDPVQVSKDYDRDALLFYLFYDVPVGADGDFSRERFKGTWEKMLIGGRGNFVNRVASLGKKYGITHGKFDAKRFTAFKKDEKFDLLDLIEHFNQEQFENRYLEHADLKDLVEDWYVIVQLANEYITVAEPRKKYKEESTQQEAIEDLEFLLWVIKQLGLLSSGILIHGFEKLKVILGNEAISKLDSTKNNQESDFSALLGLEEFEVNLDPQILYERKEG